jgi:hypothetical protein
MTGLRATPFRYDRARRRLWVNCPHAALGELQAVIQQAVREQLLPSTLDAVLCEMPPATLIVRGAHLDQWLSGVELVGRRRRELDDDYGR